MPMMSFARALALAAALALPITVQAQQQTLPGLGDPKAPLEIEADNGLELFQERNMVVAKGNVVARQGQVVLHSDILSASYEDSPQEQRRIRRIDAVGNVRITTAKERLFGDHVTYDLVRELMLITGEGMRIEAQKQTIRADKSLEFWGAEQRAVARGNAEVTQDTTSLRADVIEAILAKRNSGTKGDKPPAPSAPAIKAPAGIPGLPAGGSALTSGNTSLERIRAWGNVRIKTATEIIEGDQGDYDVPSQVATLTGNVQITRGKNRLSGEQAIVDLKTGVSRLVGSKSSRVRTILYPGGNADTGGSTTAAPETAGGPDGKGGSMAKPAAVPTAAAAYDGPIPLLRPRPGAAAAPDAIAPPAPPLQPAEQPAAATTAAPVQTEAADATLPTDDFEPPIPPARAATASYDGLLPRPRPKGAL